MFFADTWAEIPLHGNPTVNLRTVLEGNLMEVNGMCFAVDMHQNVLLAHKGPVGFCISRD